jgi:ParB/RepB/Spo0J family partition protein
MNAPTRAAELADPKVELLPLTAIAPSETHIQEMRRARFTKEALKDLADSITRVGVLQAVVVRPLSALRGLAKYELVAGERRWLAAKLAGVNHVPCTIRTLNDEEVLEVQLIENLQREGLHELEEAEGYDALMKLKKATADQLVDMVGKSRSYIYGRVKLLALCPEARKAFYAGEVDASRALLIARIGHHDTQRQALKDLTDNQYGQGPMSYREAHAHVLRTYMLQLKAAPFDTKDPDLVPKAGDCEACPKRTGNQRDLFTDVKDPNVCTDPKCFIGKREAHVALEVKRLEAAGKKVVKGEEAKKLFPGWERGSDYLLGGYVELSSITWAGGKAQKVSEVLGKDYEPTVVVHPGTGKLYKIATQQAVTKAAAAKDPKRKAGDARPIPQRDDALEEEINQRIVAVLANKPLALDQLVLAHIVDIESEAWGHGIPDYLLKALKLSTTGQVKFAKLDAKVLTKLLVLGNVLEGLTEGYGTSEKFADDVCKRFGVDAKKIRALILEERKKEAAAKAEPAKKAPAKAKGKKK